MICKHCKHRFKLSDFSSFYREVFCPNCGQQVEANTCTNPNCKDLMDSKPTLNDDDCYCSYCGSKSTYYAENLIEPVKHD